MVEDEHGDIHTRAADGYTVTLAAAVSYIRNLNNTLSLLENQSPPSFERCEQVMNLLLGRGAKANDSVVYGYGHVKQTEPSETVLTLATPKGSPALIRRLIDKGANVHIYDCGT